MAPVEKLPDKSTYSGRFAARVRQLRKASGMTVEDVSLALRKIGIKASTATVYHWENGRNEPSLDTLPFLARVLKCSIHELLPGK